MQLSKCCIHFSHPLTHMKHFSPFLTDLPPEAGEDKPRAHLTGNSPWCAFQETMGHGPDIYFSMFAKTHSSSFKQEITPLDNRLLLSVNSFQMSFFLEGSKGPGLLGIILQMPSALFLSLLFLTFTHRLSHSEMAFLTL